MIFPCVIFPMAVRLSCMQMTPLFTNIFPNLLTCQTFNLISISSTTGSAVITLLLCQNQIHGHFNRERSIPDFSMHLNNETNEQVSSAKFLGIFVSSSHSWNFQVDHICKKARRAIGYIHRAFHIAPIITRRILYLALVRPILEYGGINWHPLNKSLTNRFESCQRFACRVVLQSWNDSHEDLLLKPDLPYFPNVVTLPRFAIFTKLS